MSFQGQIELTEFHLLGRFCKTFNARAQEMLVETGIPRGQAMVLIELCHNQGVTHSELAKILMVSLPTMSNLLKRMEKSGFIERRRDKDDQRVSRVYVKDSGLDKEGLMLDKILNLQEEILGGISPKERQIFREMLERVLERLSKS